MTSLPQPVTGYGAVGVTWAPRRGRSRRTAIAVEVRTRTDGHLVGLDRAGVPRRPRPRPGQREAGTRGPAPTRCWSARSTRCRSARGDRAACRPTCGWRSIDPGHGRPRPPSSGPRWTPTTMDAAEARPSRPSGTDAGRRRRTRSSSQAATYTPKPQIYSRAQWGADERMREKSSLQLLRGARRLRPPHGERQRLHARRGPGDPAQHLRLPHAVARAGPTSATTSSSTGSAGSGRAGTAASTARSSAPTPSTTTSTRSRCRRSATSSPSSRRGAMIQAYGALFAWKLSLHGVDAASSTRQSVGSKHFPAINGHRDAGGDRLPGQVPLRQDPADPRRLAAEAQRGWAGASSSPTSPARRTRTSWSAAPATARASSSRPAASPASARAVVGAGRAATRRHGGRRRPTSPGTASATSLVRGAGGEAAVRPGTATARSAPASGRPTRLRRPRPDHRGRRRQRRRPQRPGRARPGDGPAGRLPRPRRRRVPRRQRWRHAGAATRSLVGAGDVDGDGRADLLARDAAGALWLHAGHRRRRASGPRSRCPAAGRATARSPASATSTATAAPTCSSARAGSRHGFVLPSSGDGSYGHPLGPVDPGQGRRQPCSARPRSSATSAPDLVAPHAASACVVLPNRGTFETGRPIPTRGSTCPAPTWCSTPATGTATASAT